MQQVRNYSENKKSEEWKSGDAGSKKSANLTKIQSVNINKETSAK